MQPRLEFEFIELVKWQNLEEAEAKVLGVYWLLGDWHDDGSGEKGACEAPPCPPSWPPPVCLATSFFCVSSYIIAYGFISYFISWPDFYPSCCKVRLSCSQTVVHGVLVSVRPTSLSLEYSTWSADASSVPVESCHGSTGSGLFRPCRCFTSGTCWALTQDDDSLALFGVMNTRMSSNCHLISESSLSRAYPLDYQWWVLLISFGR